MIRCLDEAKLQSYFDAELPLYMMESVTSHLAACVTCAAAARELEEESVLLSAALAAEFEMSVPTERLRERIDAAVLGERLASAQSTQKSGFANFFSGLLNLGTQRTLGYASLVVVLALAVVLGIATMRTSTVPSDSDDRRLASAEPPKNPEVASVEKAPTSERTEAQAIEVTVPTERKSNKSPRQVRPQGKPVPSPEPVKLLPGERAYLQTIARLDSTIQQNKNTMRPALQVEYERNLAVVDHAIAATRSAAKSNPNNPDAADFMFAAYQSKVDLLNTIADARLSGGPRH